MPVAAQSENTFPEMEQWDDWRVLFEDFVPTGSAAAFLPQGEDSLDASARWSTVSALVGSRLSEEASATPGAPFLRVQELLGPRDATEEAPGARPASCLAFRSCRTKSPRVQNWRRWSDPFP